jgi:predicted nucleic acid-binding protein
VLQEILHRYVAINRLDAIQPAFDTLLGVVDEVFDVTLADVQLAKQIALWAIRVSARDTVHLAVMNRRRIIQILSFDRGFDGHPGVVRVK